MDDLGDVEVNLLRQVRVFKVEFVENEQGGEGDRRAGSSGDGAGHLLRTWGCGIRCPICSEKVEHSNGVWGKKRGSLSPTTPRKTQT